MTGIVSHKTERINWLHKRHSYLVDIGSSIEIPLMETSLVYEDRVLDPPFPETRFFEIEVDEVKKWGSKTFIFQNIIPVKAKRKPDWHLLKFRIRRGSWTITERIQKKTSSGETQWIYTDDFNILFLSSGGRHDSDMLLNLITARIDAIAQSIRSGARIPSEFENQQSCRSAFDTMFTDGVEGAFRDAVIYQQHASAISGELGANGPKAATSAISSNHGRVAVTPAQVAELHVDLTQIDELQDLSWLNE